MKLIIYNFDPKHRGPSLASDILSCLNEIVLNLDLERRDIKDIFRLRSKNGVPPVVIKFISKPLRDLVLRSSGLFSRHKLNISPDYMERERMARDKLKPLLAEARSKNMLAKLRGVRLILQDKILTYDFEDEKIIEVRDIFSNFNYLFYGLPDSGIILKELGHNLSFSVKSKILTRGQTPSYT